MSLTFYKTTEHTPFTTACLGDYETPDKATMWVGDSEYGEACVAFLNANGEGLILISKSPDRYAAWSQACDAARTLKGKAAKAADKAVDKEFGYDTGCPEEWAIEGPDRIKLKATQQQFTLATEASFF